MRNNPEDILLHKQLQMVGRLLASFSHELNNHLAVIKESNGLIIDFLDMGGVQNQAMKERLRRITGTVDGRMLLVADMARHLSGFAHRNDAPESSFQLHDVLNENLALLARSADMKSLSIATAFQESLPAIHSNPALVQFIFASIFFHLLPGLKPGGKILVVSGLQDASVSFEVRLAGEPSDAALERDALACDQALQAALTAVGARMSMQLADGRIRAVACTMPMKS